MTIRAGERIQEVEICTQDNRPHIKITLLDADAQKIALQDAQKKEAYYEIHRTEDSRYIELQQENENQSQKYPFIETLQLQKYRLIENPEQLLACMDDENCSFCIFLLELNFYKGEFDREVDFSHSIFAQETNFQEAIFSKKANFGSVTFTKEAHFQGATFTENANFGSVTFTKEAHFQGATFTENANFSIAKFTKNANFWVATFTKEVDFKEATFTEKAQFHETKFTKEADFWKATFSKEAHFTAATFIKNAYFTEATFTQDAIFLHTVFSRDAIFAATDFEDRVDFGLSQIKHLIFKKAKLSGEKKGPINLKSAQIESMNYADPSVSPQNIANRESAVVLKNIAIKQNDQIAALQFYTWEMEKFREELKEDTTQKRRMDRLIVGFEKWVSNFGTDPRRTFFWLLGSNIVFAIIYVLGSLTFNAFTSPAFWLQVLEELFSFVFIYFFYEEISRSTWLERAVFYAAFIINPILLYEIIKSFRKYSRKL